MRVERFADVDGFLEQAEAFLLAREAEHNLMLGICAVLRRNPGRYSADPYFAAVTVDGQPVAAALRTPPHNLVLSAVDDEAAIPPLVAEVGAAFPVLPGVLGPKAAADAFVRSWQAATGAQARLAMAERIYRARAAVVPDGVPGVMRPYRDADRGLVLRWFEEFVAEAMPNAPPEPPEEILAHRVADPGAGLLLWEVDGETVSLAGYGGPTPNGIRIGPVYTPPHARRRGYAAALVARLTQDLLDGGRQFCFLFTDLANPTSNSVYRRVGYEPVADVDMWAFG
jgi:predicted GNAT family acetyltransferase